jgi:transcriptional regulator with XRE-family HTH domain
MHESVSLPVDSIIFREDCYPRIRQSPETVQKYAEDLEVLPPIEVNQHHELIDGWHRWTAHRKRESTEIRATVTKTQNDAELLELAIERNASHGLQLSQDDKRDVARKIYSSTPERERNAKKAVLARILSVSERTIRGWLSRIDKDGKEARGRRIFAMWMACHTQEEIAERENVSKSIVSEICSEMAELPKPDKAAADHAADFTPPVYNVWQTRERSEQSNHPGNTEVRWLDNLLYLYTKPFDVVVDPFAGGGSTIEICKKRFRRHWVSDRKPIVEREKEIRRHDITDGLPPLPRWKDVALVYIDAPYWVQAEGMYSNDPTDLGNMSLEKFTRTLADTITSFGKKLSSGAHIALIIQPTQWKAPNHEFTDHVADMLRLVKLPVEMRYSAPYEGSPQYSAQQVTWAKDNKRCLVVTREIIVWRIGEANDAPRAS